MILTLVIFVIVLSLLVFVHELGHFWTARRFGVRVDEFGFGIPPRIFGIQKIGGKWKFTWGTRPIDESEPTIYSINWLPIGGFVKIKGENGDKAEQSDSFPAQKIWKRILIIAAGVVMNLVLCIVLLSIGYGVGMPGAVDGQSEYAIVSQEQLQVAQVNPGSPAEQAGIRLGDAIITIDGRSVSSVDDVRGVLAGSQGNEIVIEISRGGEPMTVDAVPQEINGQAGLGVALAKTGIVSYPWYLAIWHGVKTTFIWIFLIVAALVGIIKNLIMSQPLGVELSGPVGIAVMTGQAARLGWVYLLQFTALLSVNLAIINILPLPALDGGRILFLIVEKFRGKAIKQKWEILANNIGFLVLLALIIAVTYRDVLIYGGRIVSGLKGIFS